MSLLRPSFNCGPHLVQIGKREGKRQLEKESKTIYTKNYYRFLWALRLYWLLLSFTSCLLPSLLPICTKRGLQLKDGLTNDIFILSVLVTFVAPPGRPNMTTPHQFPIEIHSFIEESTPPFF